MFCVLGEFLSDEGDDPTEKVHRLRNVLFEGLCLAGVEQPLKL